LDVVEGRGRERLVAPLVCGFDARSITRARALSQVTFCGYDRRMRPGRAVLGTLLILGGLVWIAQGLDLPFAPSSFMTADRLWVLIGAAAAVTGAVLIGWARRPS
jgi:hypothetical protein